MNLRVLFHIILLSWPMIGLTQSAMPYAKPNCQSTCGDVKIPFPFGIGEECFIDDWFEIVCNSSRKPVLKRLDLEVLEISVPNGTMRVNLPVLRWCKNQDYGSLGYNLSASPFVFSPLSNVFAGLGCDNLAYMLSYSGIVGGCFSICDDKICDEMQKKRDYNRFMCDNDMTKRENRCNGFKCCQARIPSSLQVFDARVRSLNVGEEIVYNQGTKKGCKYAFLVEQEWFETNLTNPQDAMDMSHVPGVLDWGIFETSFKQLAANTSTGYKSTSDCKFYANITATRDDNSSSTQLPVFQCSCSEGFEGYPYLLQECTDKDECQTPGTCGEMMICQNYIGGYGCIPKKSRNHMLALGFGTGIGSLSLLIGIGLLCIMIKRRRAIKLKEKFFKQNGGLLLKQQLTSSDGTVDKSKLFSSRELDKATDNFNESRILGQGGQGTVYKGMLSDGRIVAIKKSKAVDEGKVHEFINEVTILSQINHRNVVKLLGCCLETEVPLLVYEFIPNGTLFQYLHDQNEELPWHKRLQIAVEIAGALSYLHSAASFPIYHRDIKSSNILLDEKYRAKIADFGTSRSIAIDQTHVTTKVQGTLGYLDPEYFQSGQFTDKSDVYCFGVVLVELLTGETPISSRRSNEGKSLVAYFMISIEENRLHDILDARLPKQGKKDEIIAVANLAKRCLNLNGKRRPTMKEVSMALEGIQATEKDFNIHQTHQEIEFERTEVFEPWDVDSSSTSTFDIVSPSIDAQPLLTNTSS